MIIGHPGTWQQFQFRPDNKGLNVMEMKSKYLHEQYLFEAQMLNLQQIQQQNMFMNGTGGGGPSSSTPTYSTALQLTFNDTLAGVASDFGFDPEDINLWNGKFINGGFEALTINNSDPSAPIITLKGNDTNIGIDADAFQNKTTLFSLIDLYNNCINEIGSNCFETNSAIQNVILNNVTTIGTAAFVGCSSLSSVSFNSLTTIPDGNSEVDGVFANCDLSGLDNFDDGFPSLQIAGAFSFYQTGLNSVRSSTLNSIGIQAFARSSVGTIDISTDSTITIRDRAFNNCSSLNTITIPSKIDWTSVTTQFLGVADEGNGVFNASDISEGSVTYLQTSPKDWIITSAS